MPFRGRGRHHHGSRWARPGRGGRGGRGGIGNHATDFNEPPAEIVELGEFMHASDDGLLCKSNNEMAPFAYSPVYLRNKTAIGEAYDVFGQIDDFCIFVRLYDRSKVDFTKDSEFFIEPSNLQPPQSCLPRSTRFPHLVRWRDSATRGMRGSNVNARGNTSVIGREIYGRNSNDRSVGLEEIGTVTHAFPDGLVCKCTSKKVPDFHATVYFEDKTKVGDINDVFGQIGDCSFAVMLENKMTNTEISEDSKIFIDPAKLLPAQQRLPKSPRSGRIVRLIGFTARGRGGTSHSRRAMNSRGRRPFYFRGGIEHFGGSFRGRGGGRGHR